MITTFDRPPLNEVALARIFLPRLDLLVPHYGLLWEQLRDVYPMCRQAPPIMGPHLLFPSDLGGVLPRVWFISQDETRIVQLQQDRLIVNWRQMQSRGEYVRFSAIDLEYERVRAILERFFVENFIVPLQTVGMELTYVNIVPLSQSESLFTQVARIVRGMGHESNYSARGEVSMLHSQMDWRLADGSIHTLKYGAGSQADGQKILRLEISTSISGQDPIDEDAWVSAAHDRIVETFVDSITPAMHEQWGLRRE